MRAKVSRAGSYSRARIDSMRGQSVELSLAGAPLAHFWPNFGPHSPAFKRYFGPHQFDAGQSLARIDLMRAHFGPH